MFRSLLSCCRSFLLISFLGSLTLLAIPAARAQALIDTIAGVGLDSGPPEATGLQTAGTAWDAEGNAYAAYDNFIWKIHPDGFTERIAGTGEQGFSGDGGPALQAKLAAPRNLQRDGAGNLYFQDTFNFRIRRISTNGVITTVAGNGIRLALGMALEGRATDLPLSGGFTVTASGKLYLADGFSTISNGVIRAVDGAGNVKVIAGSVDPICSGCADGDGGLAKQAHFNPAYLAANDVGLVWVTDGKTGDLRRVDLDGTIRTLYAAGLTGIGAAVGSLAADNDGNAYLARLNVTFLGPPLPHYVIRVAPDGTPTQLYGNPNLPTVGRGPAGKAWYAVHNQLYDAESGTLLATYPDGARVSSEDGTPAKAARISPKFVAVNHAGEVFFVEDCRIRKIDAQAKLKTVAGTATCRHELPNLPGISSMAFAPDDTLWIRAGGYTFRLDPDGTLSEPPHDYGRENYIAVDAKGRVYSIGPTYLNRYNPDDGTLKIVVKGQSAPGPYPDGTILVDPVIGTDAAGTVYFTGVAYPHGTSLFRVSDDGQPVEVMQLPGELPNTGPIHIDAQGRLWSGVSVADAQGTVHLGLRNSGFSGDGSFAQAARIDSRMSAFAPNGDLYVLENYRIRRITGLGQTQRPQIDPGGVVSAASYAGGSIVPGQIVSVFGHGFGQQGLQVAAVENNHMPTVLGRIKILFNGVEAPILAATDNVVNVIVPSDVASVQTASVRVQLDDAVSDPVTIPVAPTAFHLFTLDSSGSGQGAILNSDLSVNSRQNPAAAGSIIVLYGTGEGAKTPQQDDGSLAVVTPYPDADAAFTVKIGGQNAEVVYHSAAPTLVLGAYQINVRLPQGLPAGDQPVEVTFAGGQTSRTVTVAVQ